MSTIHPNISFIAQNYDGILLDAYGVFWGGNGTGLLPGAKEAMRQLVASGKIVGILSNTTQSIESEIIKLEKHGVNVGQHFHFMITSGFLLEFILNKAVPIFPVRYQKFWVLGKDHPRFQTASELLKNTPFKETNIPEEADFVYISVPHIEGIDQENPEVFRELVKSVSQYSLPMVCGNPDHFAHEGNPPRPVVRQGSLAALYEEMGGTVHYFGKPHSDGYVIGMEHFKKYQITEPSKILMVGDTLETDIRGANNFGMSSALILNTGMTAEKIAKHGLEAILNGISKRDAPSHLINFLGSP